MAARLTVAARRPAPPEPGASSAAAESPSLLLYRQSADALFVGSVLICALRPGHSALVMVPPHDHGLPGSMSAKIPAFVGVLGCVVFVALSLSTSAATRFYQWPWFFYWQVLLAAPSQSWLPAALAWPSGALWRMPGRRSHFACRSQPHRRPASPFRPQSLNLALSRSQEYPWPFSASTDSTRSRGTDQADRARRRDLGTMMLLSLR